MQITLSLGNDSFRNIRNQNLPKRSEKIIRKYHKFFFLIISILDLADSPTSAIVGLLIYVAKKKWEALQYCIGTILVQFLAMQDYSKFREKL